MHPRRYGSGCLCWPWRCCMSAVSIWFGGHATAREATVYTVLAGVSLVMLWNLNRHGRAETAARELIAARARVAREAGGGYPSGRQGLSK
jgi:hypothetical protein